MRRLMRFFFRLLKKDAANAYLPLPPLHLSRPPAPLSALPRP